MHQKPANARRTFEYYFYVELEGQPGEQASKTLLEALGQICNTLRGIGGLHKMSNEQRQGVPTE